MRYSPHAVPDERTGEGHGRGGPSGDRGSVRRAAVTFVLASTPSGHQNQAAAVDVNAAQG